VRSGGVVCDRETDRMSGAVGLCVTERWRENAERSGHVRRRDWQNEAERWDFV